MFLRLSGCYTVLWLPGCEAACYYGYLVVRELLLSVDPLEKDRLLVVFTLHLHHDAVLSGLLLGAAGDTPAQ